MERLSGEGSGNSKLQGGSIGGGIRLEPGEVQREQGSRWVLKGEACGGAERMLGRGVLSEVMPVRESVSYSNNRPTHA